MTAAEAIAILTPETRRLLASVERPIVLVPRRHAAVVATEVAPRNPLLGLMLPYTPLHHLLLADAGVPLVMTSANLSEEPIAYRNEDALERLRDIADLLVVHDREIVTRCDDSVAAVIGGGPVLLRRSRGFVPRAITLHQPIDVPVLGCGALLKNTFCIAHRDRAWLGPHIGDLENVETFNAYEEAIERMERFLGVRGEVIAHDLHPDYLSTRYALSRGASTVAVQHHHAHVASAIAEHRLEGPVIGVAYDGTGYGTDGTAWGGEILVAQREGVSRAATFRPLRLPGGDTAIRQPWRITLGLLLDAFGDAPPVERLRLFDRIATADVHAVRQMLAAGINTPLARGVGRYFDAFGALALGRPTIRYEGQLAFELNMAADPYERGRYPYVVDRPSGIAEIDLRPAVSPAVADLMQGVTAAVISSRFHATVVAATAEAVEGVARLMGLGPRPPVVLTGGCFQNALLAEGLQAQLASSFEVFLHRQVPPGDGGIALGQAVVAAATARG
jgi:hydrogenase maturation protein HypF